MKHFTLILTLSVMLLACKKETKDPEPVTPTPKPAAAAYTINGDGYVNKTMEFKTPFEAKATLTKSINNTHLVVQQKDGNDSFFVSLNFGGNGTGLAPFGNTTGGSIGFKKPGSMTFYASKSGGGSIVITEYGEVGEHIIGSFSGTFFNPYTSATVEITNGKFDVIRQADKP